VAANDLRRANRMLRCRRRLEAQLVHVSVQRARDEYAALGKGERQRRRLQSVWVRRIPRRR